MSGIEIIGHTATGFPICKPADSDLIRVCGSSGFTSQSSDVEEIPNEAIDNMCDFRFEGLTGKGKIVSVTDGDTVRMLVHINLRNLNNGVLVRGKKKYPLICSPEPGGFFVTLKIRLLGIDTAEKDTQEGKLASQLMKDKYAETKNIVYYKLFKNDKYGRTLAELYPTSDMKLETCLNNYLMGNEKLIHAYDGGTKTIFQ